VTGSVTTRGRRRATLTSGAVPTVRQKKEGGCGLALGLPAQLGLCAREKGHEPKRERKQAERTFHLGCG
jgi:hypothetical protein